MNVLEEEDDEDDEVLATLIRKRSEDQRPTNESAPLSKQAASEAENQERDAKLKALEKMKAK